MRATYLTGERIYLRGLVAADKECATAWFDSPYPIDAGRAERFLREEHNTPWPSRRRHYAIVRRADDVVVGGVREESPNQRSVTVAFHLAPALPDADSLRAEALRLVVPWLRDEREFVVVRAWLPEDAPETLAAAEAVGMVATARLRGYFARPGGRVDALIYHALRQPWEAPDA
ncbi:MAG: hypothetical protein IRY97_01090 [Thermomicrobiaceae bacterium]|nr:hypothetical protein [Thermomicrobiaceae bacterium]